MNTFKSIIVAAVMVAVSALSAFAGSQTEISTNVLAVASTNTFALYGDITGSYTNGEVITQPNQYIDGSKSTDLYGAVGGFFTNTTAQASNITYRIAQSVNSSVWTNSAISPVLIVPANTTNWVEQEFKISGAYPYYALRGVENANAAAVTGKAGTLYFRVFSKNGL